MLRLQLQRQNRFDALCLFGVHVSAQYEHTFIEAEEH